MDPSVGGALIAFVGTLIGLLGTRWIETVKAKNQQQSERESAYREQLRAACSEHASNLTTYLLAARDEGRAFAATHVAPTDYVPSQIW